MPKMRIARGVNAILPLLLLTAVAGAFVVGPRTAVGRFRSSAKTTTTMHQMSVKSAGGGIAEIPAGERRLFDPADEGKLSGSDSLNRRLAHGSHYVHIAPAVATANPIPSTITEDAQNWLEDIGLPANFAKPTQPVTATVLGRGRLIDDTAPGDIEHILLKLPKGFHYVEGQSLSVIPPGLDAASGKPHKPRLYSIASTRYGDLLDGATVSLCVRRAEYTNQVTGLVDPTMQGVCSNFLCNLRAGDTVQVAGPVGKTMLLPEDFTTDIIMVATGTGIAPFRAFLHRLFMENTVACHMFTGSAWLILGVPVTGGLLYPKELEAMRANAHGNLKVTYAISREMKNFAGGKLYVQDVLAERANELFQRLDAGAVIYFCGLKGMMPGILEALAIVAEQRGTDWSAKLSELKSNHQWHVEVY